MLTGVAEMNSKEAEKELYRYMNKDVVVHYYESEFFEKSRKRSKEGDVFVIRLKECGLYFYGKVIKKGVKNKYVLGDKTDLIFLYKTPTKEIIVPEEMDCNDVYKPMLMSPNSGWLLGLFKTICNLPVTEKDLSVDYGFYEPLSGRNINVNEIKKCEENCLIFEYKVDGENVVCTMPFVDVDGNIIDHIPNTIIANRLYFGTTPASLYSVFLHYNPEYLDIAK